ncbi:lipid kinase YegS [Alginatibacterium sediminis]|uniref:Lipid kinase YegS n=1 Tax=Alginatibacterium sediminis TaxID=2164068 RepID=A0A420EAT2_9ALTE|nr:lipid kinase YegS [Alginatibacterium sediminis]RKF17781.1 lipid kinase YegS [Alginatibacterium sediminis]
MKVRLIINGKKAGLQPVRDAVYQIRDQGCDLEVRSTWEAGDVLRLVQEARQQGVDRIIAGGGDGTVNEAVDALMTLPKDERCELAILPLGTANDFATSLGQALDPLGALQLAYSGASEAIDIGKINKRHFVNIATAGFGAKVTAQTPIALKNFLGGGAYTLQGLIQALDFVPYTGTLKMAGKERRTEVVVGGVCNGRQAGGGQVLAPQAYINDGLLDVVGVVQFPAVELSNVVRALLDPNIESNFVFREQVPSLEFESHGEIMPINLDGEPYAPRKAQIELIRAAVRLVVPENCPLIATAAS